MNIRVPPINNPRPWLQALVRPRQAIHALEEPDSNASTLAALVGILQVSVLILVLHFAGLEKANFILPLLIIGVALGIAGLELSSSLAHFISRRGGGRASIEETRGALAWASLPIVLMGLVMLPILAYLLIGQPDVGRLYRVMPFILIALAFHGWVVVLVVANLSEVNQVSTLRTIGGLAVAAVILVILLAVVGLAVFVLHRIPPIIIAPDAAPIVIGIMVACGAWALVMGTRGNLLPNAQRFKPDSPLWNGKVQPAHIDVEITASFSERLVKPLWSKLTSLVTETTPQSNLQSLEKDLALAGFPYGLSVPNFLGLRLLSGLLLGGLGLTICLIKFPLQQAIALGLLALALGIYLPMYWLRRRINQRKEEMQRALPEVLDMLSICVSAGLGFDAALLRVAYRWDNALAIELRQVVTETRVGVARSEALRRLVRRADIEDLATFVAVIAQAERLGVSIGRVLKIQSEQLRMRRRQHAEEEAHKAPAKMLLPMALFILPGTMLIIIGPAIPRFVRLFAGY